MATSMAEENLVKPGEKEMEQMKPLIYHMIEILNTITSEREIAPTKMSKLMVFVGRLVLYKDRPDLVIKELWEQLEHWVKELSADSKLTDLASDINSTFSQMQELRVKVPL